MTYRGVTLINFPDVPVTASFSPLMVKEWTRNMGRAPGPFQLSGTLHSLIYVGLISKIPLMSASGLP